MPAPELVGGLFCCVVILGVVGGCLHVDRAARRKSRARLAEMERRREESRVYWAARIQEARDREAEAQRAAQPVAQTSLPPHNPGQRRLLPLD